jgi:Alginate lyase
MHRTHPGHPSLFTPALTVVLYTCLMGSTPVLAAEASPAEPASHEPTTPRFLLHSAQALARHKARWLAQGRPAEPALTRLLDDARRALDEKPFSVTRKVAVPPSGDKHDYLSLAPYYWPDPHRPAGLPYVNRDGKSNPERDTISDHKDLARIGELVETLGLAYFFTDDERYARHAALLVRAFFLDPATRMNPNLKFAQGVRGKEDGRPAGIIDGIPITRVVDGVGLLLPSAALSNKDRSGLDAWFRAYLTWLRESDLGRKEGQAKNNHGTWYDVQVVALALATGQEELAREVLGFAHKRRIGREIEPDGRQPEELQRTRAWHYALYNLQAFVALANLGDAAGVDLWRYQTPDGRSIRKAIDWLVPFALRQQPWTAKAIDGFSPEALWPIVREAAARLQDSRLSTIAERLGKNPADRLMLFE